MKHCRMTAGVLWPRAYSNLLLWALLAQQCAQAAAAGVASATGTQQSHVVPAIAFPVPAAMAAPAQMGAQAATMVDVAIAAGGTGTPALLAAPATSVKQAGHNATSQLRGAVTASKDGIAIGGGNVGRGAAMDGPSANKEQQKPQLPHAPAMSQVRSALTNGTAVTPNSTANAPQLVPLSTDGHQKMPPFFNKGRNQDLKSGGPPESTGASQALHAAAAVAAAVIAGRPSAVAIDAHEQATAAKTDAAAAHRSASQALSTADSVANRVDELRSKLAAAARLKAEALRGLEARLGGKPR